MAECPSGKYLDEIKATAGGLTLDHPTEDRSGLLGGALDWSASEYKFADWNQLLIGVIGRLERSWMQFKVWPATAKMPAEEYNPLVDRFNSVRERFYRLRKPWTNAWTPENIDTWWGSIAIPDMSWDASSEIAAATSILVDAQCLRQQIDELLISMGGNPATPSTAHKPAGEGLGILGTIAAVAVGGALIAGVYFVGRKISKS